MYWPPKSPELNAIDIPWVLLKNKVRSTNFSSRLELKAKIITAVQKELLEKLAFFMPDRLRAVIIGPAVDQLITKILCRQLLH